MSMNETYQNLKEITPKIAISKVTIEVVTLY